MTETYTRTVWRYPLAVKVGEQLVTMPKGAQVLSVGAGRHGGLHVWALVGLIPRPPDAKRRIADRFPSDLWGRRARNRARAEAALRRGQQPDVPSGWWCQCRVLNGGNDAWCRYCGEDRPAVRHPRA